MEKETKIIIALSVFVGTCFYVALTLFFTYLYGENHQGFRAYDYYFLSLLDGRLDLPLRVLFFEGHYTPDGTAYPYHGIAPVLTRVFAYPFIDLSQTTLSMVSVLLWSVTGTTFWHLTFAQVATLGLARATRPMPGRAIQVLLAAAVWLGTPGLLLAIAPIIHHEPISMAYALAAIYVWILVRVKFFGWESAATLVVLALLAGLSVHARPNIAVGLYVGVLIQSAVHVFKFKRRAFPAVVGAMVVLGAFGSAYLGLNQYRFGNPVTVHGTFEPSEIQYGTTYLGMEEQDSPRALALKENGRFNVRRILPNAMLYIFDLPEIVTTAVHDYYRELTLKSLGFIRVGGPSLGVVYLWPVCFLLTGAAIIGYSRSFLKLSPLLVATLLIVILTLSYGTVTLRHRFDFWPFLGTLALAGTYAAIHLVDLRRLPGRIFFVTVSAAVGMGILATFAVAVTYPKYKQIESWPNGILPLEVCRETMQSKGFSKEDVERLCSLRYTESFDAKK